MVIKRDKMFDLSDTIVLIPHFNNSCGLIATLQSIDENEVVNVLVVDDGSTLKINKIELQNKFRKKLKLEVIFLSKNYGIERALNEGLFFAIQLGYKYVGRIDCGDLCLKNRFAKQRKVLAEDPHLMLVGTGVEYRTENSTVYKRWIPKTSRSELLNRMNFNTQFEHPSVMFPVSVTKLVGFYPLGFKAAEDFAYFTDIILLARATNLPEILVIKILEKKSISYEKRRRQVFSRLKTILLKRKFSILSILGITYNIALLFVPIFLLNVIKKYFQS